MIATIKLRLPNYPIFFSTSRISYFQSFFRFAPKIFLPSLKFSHQLPLLTSHPTSKCPLPTIHELFLSHLTFSLFYISTQILLTSTNSLHCPVPSYFFSSILRKVRISFLLFLSTRTLNLYSRS